VTPDVERNRDAVSGERAVKTRRSTYLPVPPGMSGQGARFDLTTDGHAVDVQDTGYSFYLQIAEFPEELGESLQGFQGIIHSKPPTIVLPTAIDYLREDADPTGRSLEKLWQVMTEEILVGGRVALLCDVTEDDRVVLAPYSVENILNWETKLRGGREVVEWVVLCERSREPSEDDPFVSVEVVRYRELRLLPDAEARERFGHERVYQQRVWRELPGRNEPQPVSGFAPVRLFGRYFPEVPIVVINALDLGWSFGPIPLSPLVKIAMSLYRRSADYNRSIYVKTDPQPYVTGVQDEKEVPTRIGGSEIWRFSAPEAKAMYLDIDGDGIPHQRTAIQDDWHRFHLQSAKLLQASETPSESGEAVRRKQAAKHVTLRAVAQNSAEGLEKAIACAAEMLQVPVDEILFKPDLDFSVPKMSGDEATKWSQAKAVGFPISDRSLHEMARQGGATEMTFEEEMEAMEDDAERVPPPAPPTTPAAADDKPEDDAAPEDDEPEEA
jgi:hypothetical protein